MSGNGSDESHTSGDLASSVLREILQEVVAGRVRETEHLNKLLNEKVPDEASREVFRKSTDLIISTLDKFQEKAGDDPEIKNACYLAVIKGLAFAVATHLRYLHRKAGHDICAHMYIIIASALAMNPDPMSFNYMYCEDGEHDNPSGPSPEPDSAAKTPSKGKEG